MKINYLHHFIQINNIDILAIQECNNPQLCAPNHYNVFTNCTETKLGTAIIYKETFIPKNIDVSTDFRLIKMDFNNFTIINVYGYTSAHEAKDRNNFFNITIPSFLKPYNNNTILLGDFNAITHFSDREQKGPINKHFLNLIKDIQFTDTFKEKNNNQISYTFISQIGKSTIDKIFIHKDSTDKITQCQHIPYDLSDHKAVVLNISTSFISIPFNKPKSAYWKLNTSILKDDHYTYETKYFIEYFKTQKQNFTKIEDWWESFKHHLKLHTIEYCTNKNHEEARFLNFLYKCRNDNSSDNKKILEINKIIDDIQKRKFQGTQTRGRQILQIEDEITSIAHLTKERTKGEKKNLENILDNAGNILSSQKDIENFITHYYKQLFTLENKNTKGQTEFLKEIDKFLCPEEISILEEDIQKSEILQAITDMTNLKSPGLDGIPIEFYKTFYNEITDELHELFSKILENGHPCTSQSTALITLIPKSGDLHDIKNWRPISLSCTDYKILAKILANRFKKILPTIISEEQTGGVPNKNIFENLSFLRNILLSYEHIDRFYDSQPLTKIKHPHAAILALDFEKAYDRVDRSFLYKILETFKFPPFIIKWIQTLYEHSTSKILINGEISNSFNIGRGVKQGCPMAMYLYILYIEPLILKLKKKSYRCPYWPCKTKN